MKLTQISFTSQILSHNHQYSKMCLHHLSKVTNQNTSKRRSRSETGGLPPLDWGLVVRKLACHLSTGGETRRRLVTGGLPPPRGVKAAARQLVTCRSASSGDGGLAAPLVWGRGTCPSRRAEARALTGDGGLAAPFDGGTCPLLSISAARIPCEPAKAFTPAGRRRGGERRPMPARPPDARPARLPARLCPARPPANAPRPPAPCLPGVPPLAPRSPAPRPPGARPPEPRRQLAGKAVTQITLGVSVLHHPHR